MTKPKEPESPPVCPYCGTTARLAQSKQVYRRDYGGWLWVCGQYPRCDSYVGCHKGTKLPLGIMANAELRELKQKCHAAFDPLWKSGRMTRDEAYEALAAAMCIPFFECHIGEFNVLRCKAALDCIRRIKSEVAA
jgi:ssDNA-binding Zn-finger/Zn-ribbon topoisomerase 1